MLLSADEVIKYGCEVLARRDVVFTVLENHSGRYADPTSTSVALCDRISLRNSLRRGRSGRNPRRRSFSSSNLSRRFYLCTSAPALPPPIRHTKLVVEAQQRLLDRILLDRELLSHLVT